MESEATPDLKESLDKFYRTMTAVQIAAVDYIRAANSDSQMAAYSSDMTDKFYDLLRSIKGNDMDILCTKACWDEVRQRCVC